MAQQALATSEALTNLSNNGQALSESITNLAGGMAHIQNMPAVANVNHQAQILQALIALTNSVNQGNQRLNVVTQRLDAVDQRLNGMQQTMNNRFNGVNTRFDDVNTRFNDVNTRFNGIDRSVRKLREDLVWEQDTAYKRTMNATAGSGPYEIILRNPRVPDHVQYDEDNFPEDIEKISKLTNQKCNALAAAWGLDLAGCANVKERKRRVAHFIGVHFNV